MQEAKSGIVLGKVLLESMFRGVMHGADPVLGSVCTDMGPRATGQQAVATVVVDKMRRRMRQNGYHAHITLQVRMSSSSNSWDAWGFPWDLAQLQYAETLLSCIVQNPGARWVLCTCLSGSVRTSTLLRVCPAVYAIPVTCTTTAAG